MKLFAQARRALAMALAMALVVATACGGGDAAADPIPTELADVEAAAEDGFDAALKPDRAQLLAAAQKATNSWAAYGARAGGDAAPADALDEVTAAITAVNSLAAANAPALDIARAFNRLSAPMARLYAIYKPPVPVTLLDLDHLGREVLLDARAADMQRATTDLDALSSRWTAFRAQVIAAGGTAQAAQMDGTLNQARNAIAANDPAALELAAVAEAEAVDVIENLFARRDAPD
jgi:hypothetical protein